MFRADDALRRMAIASSWLHRFCAMIAPTAISIAVRDSIAI
jgi:hypothetical protein